MRSSDDAGKVTMAPQALFRDPLTSAWWSHPSLSPSRLAKKQLRHFLQMIGPSNVLR
jgi:hypothetical protein